MTQSLQDNVKLELKALCVEALSLREAHFGTQDLPWTIWPKEIPGGRANDIFFELVLETYVDKGFDHDRNYLKIGGDVRSLALQFATKFHEELRDIICNSKRRSEAGRISHRNLTPVCAALAVYLIDRIGLKEPIATMVATYLLVVFLECTRGAYCKMTANQLEELLKERPPAQIIDVRRNRKMRTHHQKVSINTVSNSIGGPSPGNYTEQDVIIDIEPDVVRVSVDGIESRGAIPVKVWWIGGKAKYIDLVTDIKILSENGERVISGEIDSNQPPKDVHGGVLFYVHGTA